MSIGDPVLLAEGTLTNASDTYTTTSVSARAGSLVVLTLSIGGNNPIPAHPVASVTGAGLTWELVRSEVTSNERVRGSTWVAHTKGSTASGAITVTLESGVSRVAYKVIEVPGAGQETPRAIGNVYGGADPVTFTVPDVLGGAAQLAVTAFNTTSTVAQVVGYQELGSRLTYSSPSGALQAFYRRPAETDTVFDIPTTAWKAVVVIEVPEDQEEPPVGTAAYLVIDGVEVPVVMTYVEDGVEVPVREVGIQ